LKTLHLSDVLVVEWSGAPDQDGEYRLRPDVPDFPVAFGYGGARIGVLVPHGIARTVLEVDGVEGPAVTVDANGFASMRVTGQTGLLAEQSLQVNLYDSGGHIVRTLPVPSAA
jgi:hypothetical protein